MGERNAPLVEMLAQAKTVRLRGRFPMPDGTILDVSGPMECWISALVQTLPPESKAAFATVLNKMVEQREHQVSPFKARVVAEILMPDLSNRR